jgi:hypothetical protein
MNWRKILCAAFHGGLGGLIMWGGLYLIGVSEAGFIAWGYCIGIAFNKECQDV